MVEFGTLTRGADGKTVLVNVRQVSQAAILRCPHVIMVPEHYRADGTCRCDEQEERDRLIAECGYKARDFKTPARTTPWRSMTDMTVEEQQQAIEERFVPLIKGVLESIGKELRRAHYRVDKELLDMSDDNPNRVLGIKARGAQQAVDVSMEILWGADNDGEEDTCAFALTVVEYGGRILGGLTPYYYSEELWVRMSDLDAVYERFAIFQRADPASLVQLLNERGK